MVLQMARWPHGSDPWFDHGGAVRTHRQASIPDADETHAEVGGERTMETGTLTLQ